MLHAGSGDTLHAQKRHAPQTKLTITRSRAFFRQIQPEISVLLDTPATQMTQRQGAFAPHAAQRVALVGKLEGGGMVDLCEEVLGHE